MSLEVDIRKTFGTYSLDVSFKAENEVFGLLGASGCGKSLTMRSIAGIETPDEGRIVVNGEVFFDSEKGINVLIISTSEIRIAALVPLDQLNDAVKALHTAYGLDADQVEAVVYGGTGR